MLTALAATLALGSGAAGTVVIAPARPVCQVGRPCSAPDAHDTLVFWSGSRRVARVETSAVGAFRVALPAGYYRITFPNRRLIVRPTAPTFAVRRGAYTQLHLSIDVGIR